VKEKNDKGQVWSAINNNSEQQQTTERRTRPMRKSHSILFLALILATVCASAFADAPAGVVNINTADASQLSLLPRVGAKAAQRIVDYRTQNGPFHKLTDLMQVKGFGDKTFERVSPYITLEGKTTLTAKVQGPKKPRSKAARQQPSSTASK
jgi:competence protein ComEA